MKNKFISKKLLSIITLIALLFNIMPISQLMSTVSALGSDSYSIAVQNTNEGELLSVIDEKLLADGKAYSDIIAISITGVMGNNDFDTLKLTVKNVTEIDILDVTSINGIAAGSEDFAVPVSAFYCKNKTGSTTAQLSDSTGYSNLIQVKMPDKIKKIGAYAFSDCANLALTSLPNEVTEIGGSAFANCPSLPVVLNCNFDTAPSIAEDAFLNSSVKYFLVNDGVYDDNQKLNEITAVNRSGDFDSDGENNLNEYNNDKLLYKSDVIVSLEYKDGKVTPTAKSIYNNQTITMNSSYYSITYTGNTQTPPTQGSECTAVFKLTDSGNEAYVLYKNNEESASSIELNFITSDQAITEESGDSTTNSGVLYNTASVDSYSITVQNTNEGELLSVIDAKLLEDGKAYSDVTAITIRGVMGNSDFDTLKVTVAENLTEVDISDVTAINGIAAGSDDFVIPEHSFYYFYKTGEYIRIYDSIKYLNLTNVKLPDKIKRIGDQAFHSCTSLALTSLPSGITSIGSTAFYGCTNLALTSLPSGLTSIGIFAFNDCINLALTSLPNGLTSIDEYVFYRCKKITLTSLPSGLTKIGSSAFQGCANITLTSLPSGVTSLGMSSAFWGCTKLALTSLPSGLTRIGNSTFYGCTNLALTSLPSGLNSIKWEAFQGCTNLALTSLPSVLESIERHTFYGCTNLALTSLPSGLTSIDEYAFDGCTKLALTSLPSGLTSIGEYAFNGCTNLALTSLPSGLTTIRMAAFENCSSLPVVLDCNFNKAPLIAEDAFSNSPVKFLLVKDGIYADKTKINESMTAVIHSGDFDNDGGSNLIEYNNNKLLYKADVIVSLESKDGKIIPTATSIYNKDMTIDPSDYSITYVCNSQTPPNKAVYTATFSLTDSANEAYTLYKDKNTIVSSIKLDFEVTLVDQTGVTAKPYNSIYDGAYHGITVNADGGTVSYKTNVDDNYSSTVPTFKDVGTYTVYYKVTKDFYNDFIGFADVTISPKELTVSVTVDNKRYDGLNNATINKVELTGVLPGETVTLTNGTAAFTSVNAANNIPISFTPFSISGDDIKNYTLKQPTGVTANIESGFTPVQGTHYTLSEHNDLGWSKSDFVITAKDGYLISENNTADGKWKESLICSEEIEYGKLKFYIKNVETGEISVEKNESYNIDKSAPTGKITVKTNEMTSFFNTITFGLFFKETVDITITGEDNLSGVSTIEYQKVDSQADYDQDGIWETYNNKFSEEPNQKFIIYARITDNVGNVTIINSNGVVLYTDSEQETKGITFTKTSTEDVTAKVILNGNTINAIKNGEKTLANGTDYTVSKDGEITFKASYLDTLSADNYTLTVSYNPLGEEYVQSADNMAPKTTEIALTVKRADQSTITVTGISKTQTYGDGPFELNITGGTGTGSVNYTSSNKDLISIDKNKATILKTGAVTITATKAGDDNYNKQTDTISVTVSPKSVTITGLSAENKVYDGSDSATVKGTAVIDGKIETDDLKVSAGTAKFSDENAGTKKTVTFSGYSLEGNDANNYSLSAQPKAVTADISKADQTGFVFDTKEPEDLTYSPNLSYINKASGGNGDGAISYAITGGTGIAEIDDQTGELSNITKTGTITVTATKAESQNYNKISASYTLNVLKADQSAITVTGISKAQTYGDGPFDLNITGGNGKGSVTYTSSNKDVISIDKNVATILKTGTVTITATKAGDGNYNKQTNTISVTVSPKSVTITGLSAEDKVYDGSDTAQIKGTAVIDGKIETDDLKVSAGTAKFSDKNAGTNKAVTFSAYSLEGDDANNYVLSAQPKAVTADISTKTVTITGLSVENKIYDGLDTATVNGTAVINGKIETDDLKVSAGTAKFSDKNAGTNKAVTFSGYSLEGDDANNYVLSAQPKAVTADISTKTVTITGLSAENKIYDGLDTATVNGTAVIDGKIETDDLKVSEGTAKFSDKNADIGKTVTFSGYSLEGDDANNYSLSAQPKAVTADIAKADQKGFVFDTKEPEDLTYSPDLSYTNTASGGNGDGAISYAITGGTGTAETNDQTGELSNITKTGTITVTATKAESQNYNKISASYTLNVLKAGQSTITVTGISKTQTYGDGPFDLNITGGKGTGSVTYTSSDKDVISINKNVATILKAGTATITATKAGDDNYSEQTGTINVTISPKELTVSVTVNNKKYDGLNNATINKAELVGVLPGETVTLTNGTATFTSVNAANDIPIIFTPFSISGDDIKNYTLKQPTGVTANIESGFTPVQDTHYTLSEQNDSGWSKSDFVITAVNGYLISENNTADGKWKESLICSEEIKDGKLKFYIKNVETGEISVEKIESYNIDKSAPTGKITVKTNEMTSFLNTITFGLFFKETVDITITGEDNLSGVSTIEYQKVAQEADYDQDGTWETYNKFSEEPNQKFIIYARITDNVGNVSIINSNGVVLYTDSEQETEGITFTKTSTEDVTAKVILNGNTINAIKNGEKTLANGTNYTVSEDGEITFKASYLDTLSADNYTLTVSYNPMGEEYVQSADNMAPETTEIALTVKKADPTSITVTGISKTQTYGDGPFELNITGGKGTGSVTYTSNDNEVISIDKNAATILKTGTVTITATKAGDDNYNKQTDTISVTVSPKSVTITGLSAENKVYDGSDFAKVKGTAVIDGKIETDDLKVSAGTAKFSDKNAGTKKAVTFSGYSLEGQDVNNYVLSAQPKSVTADISTKSVTITGLSAENKVYDGSESAKVKGTAVINGKIETDDLKVSAGTAKFSDKNAGTNKAVTFSGYSLEGDNANNYVLSAQPKAVTADISTKTVTITGLLAEDKVYDGLDTATVKGTAIINGKIETDDLKVSAGTAKFSDKNAGTNKAVTFSGYSLNGDDANNYSLSAQPKAVTADITKADQTDLVFDTKEPEDLTYSPNFSFTNTASGGNGDGAISYAITGGTGTAEINNQTGELSNITKTGTITVTATKAESTNYNKISASYTLNVLKAEPAYTMPKNLSAFYGNTLADITLPEGFAWVNDMQFVGNIGTNRFEATFTPSDIDLYNIVTILIDINVYAVTSELEKIINEAQKVIDALQSTDIGNGNNQFPKKTVDTLNKEIENAKKVLENTASTQAEIKTAIDTLSSALSAFEKSKISVDLTGLNKYIAHSELLSKSDGYTDESWNVLQEALKTGKAVISKVNVTQSEVNAAELELKSALNNLKRTTTDSQDPQNTQNSQNPQDSQNAKSPQTGDYINPLNLIISLILMSIGIVLGIKAKKFKKKF